jgi:hypothetical protein
MSSAFPPLRYNMLDVAASQEGCHSVPSIHSTVTRVALKDLFMKHQGFQIPENNENITASQTLSQISQLIPADLQDWHIILQGFQENHHRTAHQIGILNQRESVYWSTLRFGKFC